MTLSVQNLLNNDLSLLRQMETNYSRALDGEREREEVARLKAEGYVRDIAAIREAIEQKFDPNGPLTADQRRALFASFESVFASREPAARYAFTRLVLGVGTSRTVSWSEHKPGAITHAEASKVLDALSLLEAAL